MPELVSGIKAHFHTLEDMLAGRPCPCTEPESPSAPTHRVVAVDHEERSITLEALPSPTCVVVMRGGSSIKMSLSGGLTSPDD